MENNYIELIYKEACKAYKKNEVPVGAIIVCNDKIIAKAHNNKQSYYDVLGHAEINCIKKASRKLRDWRLDNCIMYVTLAPCKICQSVIKESRISKVYYLINNNKYDIAQDNITQTNVCNDINDKYKKMLEQFFKNMRK